MKVRYGILGTAFALAFAAAFGAAQAQDYPSRSVTFIVPYAPGGGTDVFSRLLAEELRTQLKQTFVVENRPGAATAIAAAAVSKSAPDGYTIMMGSSTTLAMNPSLYNKLTYDPGDLAPIGLVGAAYFVMVANPSVPAKTLPELIAYIKSKPGELSYGTSGPGTPHHLFMEMFMSMTGTKMNQIPYKGSVPALTDVVSGQIPLMIVDLTPSLQLIQEGKLRAFGLTGSARVKTAPEIPTLAEAGLPGYAGQGWFGLVTKAGTPKPIVEKLNDVVSAYIKRPETQDRLYAIGIQPIASTTEEFAKFIPAEQQKWSKVIADAKIQKMD
ncbi:MAG TPA: tripartite tricarboxylate transporter substrate binding protein [Xanthobacteraceae bacterium]|nr:tripartite tricarboxylate transporter substrate binding protein [Xanthobacteraceae bacterium]